MADFTGIDLFGEIYDADDANAVQQSQVVPAVDADSDDDHIPTAKAVFDAIVSGQIPAFHYEEFELPNGCDELYIEPGIITAYVTGTPTSITPDSNYPLNAIAITNLANVDASFNWFDFPYDGQPADWNNIDELLYVSTPTDSYIYVKVHTYSSGGSDFYNYVRYRILNPINTSGAGFDHSHYCKVWDELSLYPEVNASGNIDKIVLNGTERAIEDPGAADQTLSNLSDTATARTNLGLGTGATANTTNTYTSADGSSNLTTIIGIRRSNAHNTTEQFITTAANSVTGREIYRKVFRATTSVTAGSNLTLDSATPYTDIVAMYASGKDSSGNYYSIESFTDPDWCVKNTSGTTLTEVTLVALYSKS